MKSALSFSVERPSSLESAPVVCSDKPETAPVDHATPFPSIAFDNESFERLRHGRQKSTASPSEPVPAAAAIESMPHLTSRIVGLWKTRDLNTFIFELLLDSRDGSRKGFPSVIAKELLFLAKINLLLRAQEAAAILGTTVAEASDLIARGDQAALDNTAPSQDVWAVNTGNVDKSNRSAKPGNNVGPLSASRVAVKASVPRHVKVGLAQGRLGKLLSEVPPTPPSVRLDLTAPKALRGAEGPVDQGGIMDQGFFRCIAKELGGLKIGQLVLANLGDAEKCDWLPSAIHFAKVRCHFANVVLHVDLLTAPEQQLIANINAGLNHLVINLNLASGKWRAKAEAITDTDPDYFRREIRRLVKNRDEHAARTGHYCSISVIQPHRKSSHYLREAFRHLATEPGMVHFQEVVPPAILAQNHAEFHDACHCWAPFIEAHIRTNGHLVACAQDHSGYSFTADLKQTTFSEAWHSQAFQKTRVRVLHGEKPGKLCDVCPHKAVKN